MAYRLQVSGPGGKRVVVSTLTGISTLGELQSVIAKELGISAGEQSLMHGFPPQTLPVDNASASLEALGVPSGSRITVTKGEAKTGIIKGDLDASGVIFTIPRSGAGHMVRRDMPADNSCLFHSIAYTCLDRARDMAPKMRSLVGEAVSSDRGRRFSTEVLGQPPSSYVRWIQNPEVWGGGIELKIFSDHFATEIVSFDYAYLREDVFGEGNGYKKRVFLIYTGKHYDCLVFSPFAGAPEGKDKVVFSAADEFAWKKAREYVEYLHKEAVKNDSSLTLQKEWRSERDKRKASGRSLIDPPAVEVSKDLSGLSGFFRGSSSEWNCPACTFKNSASTSDCGMCGTRK